MTIRLPDDRHARLRQLAKYRGISVNKLVEEFSTIGLAQFDAELRFRAVAARGASRRGLYILDKLEASFSQAK
jgi:predicted transcriptional regulator